MENEKNVEGNKIELDEEKLFWKDNIFLFTNEQKNYLKYYGVEQLCNYVANKSLAYFKDLEKIKVNQISLEKIDNSYTKTLYTVFKLIKEFRDVLQIITEELFNIATNIKSRYKEIENIKAFTKKTDYFKDNYIITEDKINKYLEKYKDIVNKGVDQYLKLKVSQEDIQNNKPFNELKKCIALAKLKYKVENTEHEQLRQKYIKSYEKELKYIEQMEIERGLFINKNLTGLFKKIEENIKTITIFKDTDINFENSIIDAEKAIQTYFIKSNSFIKPIQKPYEAYELDAEQITSQFLLNIKNIPKSIKVDKNDLIGFINEFQQQINKLNAQELSLKVLRICEKLKKNNSSEEDICSIINIFQENYDGEYDWDDPLFNPEDKKDGIIHDKRFYFIYKFLYDLNHTRGKYFLYSSEHFDYLVVIMKKILELNEKDDECDFSIIELIIILGNTFYKIEKEKKFIVDKLKDCCIFRKPKFWLHFSNYSLFGAYNIRMEVPFKEKLDGSKTVLLVSILFNMLFFASDSNFLNENVLDIFNFFKFKNDKRISIIQQLENQIKNKRFEHLKFDQEKLLEK